MKEAQTVVYVHSHTPICVLILRESLNLISFENQLQFPLLKMSPAIRIEAIVQSASISKMGNDIGQNHFWADRAHLFRIGGPARERF